MEIKGTIVFDQNWQALLSPIRFIENRGGSRSSKTWSICQCVILDCLTDSGADWSIVRKTFPALRATVMRDFVSVLQDMKIYDAIVHHKTEHSFVFPNGARVEFFSVDNEQKLRGRKRRKCWVNECNDLFGEDFVQLNMRTTEKIIFDYNPSEVVGWIDELPPDEIKVIHSTYKDNPFLERAIANQIEDLKRTDPILYDIYALGLHAVSRENVYQKWEVLTERPKRFTQYCYGLDFGYVHPLSLVRVWYYENERYYEEVIYESYLKPNDMIPKFEEMRIEKDIEIICDHARPDLIADLRQAGYYCLNANKDVQAGITIVRSCINYIDIKAKNIQRENKAYKHKKINGEIRDKEIHKTNDDAMDAIRYADMWISKYSTNDFEETLSISW